MGLPGAGNETLLEPSASNSHPLRHQNHALTSNPLDGNIFIQPLEHVCDLGHEAPAD